MESSGRVRNIAAILAMTLVVVAASSFALPGQAHAAKTQKMVVYADSATQKTVKLEAPGLKASRAVWKSSDSKVVVVKKGKVIAKRVGKSTVSARQGKKAFTFKVVVKRVSIDKKRVALQVGERTRLALKGDKIKKVKSSNPNVVKVAKNGKIRGLAAGTATVTLKSGKNKRYRCKVTVVAPADVAAPAADVPSSAARPGSVAVSGLSFAQQVLTLKVGDEAASNPALVKPADASNKKVVYASSNEAVATVDALGTVTPVGVGAATITATSVDGGKSATFTALVAPSWFTRVAELRAAFADYYEKLASKAEEVKADLGTIGQYADTVAETLAQFDVANVSAEDVETWRDAIADALARVGSSVYEVGSDEA